MELISYAQAAKILGVPVGTVYSWVHHKRIPHHRLTSRLVRFSETELYEWLEAKRVHCA